MPVFCSAEAAAGSRRSTNARCAADAVVGENILTLVGAGDTVTGPDDGDTEGDAV